MKLLIIVNILLFSSLSLSAMNCTESPTTENLLSPSIMHTLGATDLVNLEGKDCANVDVPTFKVITLPNAATGILYMADGTAVITGQVLTRAESNALKFNPVDGFVGNATLTYVSIDSFHIEDMTPAMLTIPIVENGGGACNEAPTTDDKANPMLLNTLEAVNIINLSGSDCSNLDISKFKVITLANADAGILYMADGITAVMVGQVLSIEESNGLKFDPVDDFVGDTTFTYASIDNNDIEDLTPATINISVVENGGGACNEAPNSDDKRNENISNNLGTVNIINLSGTDCSRGDIEKFKIKTLPAEAAGILYMNDGVTAVMVGQVLTKEEANGLKFTLVDGFVGNTTFTYASIDSNNVEDITPAMVGIPVIALGGGIACGEAPTSDDKVNPMLLNNLPAANILNLSGKDCSGVNVNKFQIKTLPSSQHGILYMADGVTAVTINQTLTQEEANGLKFDPVDGFVGDVSFTYAAIDENGISDETPAKFSLPIVSSTLSGENNTTCSSHEGDCSCEDYEASIPTFSKFGILLIIMLTVLAGSFFTKKEI